MFDSGAFSNSAFDSTSFDFGTPPVCAFDSNAFSDSAFSSDAFGLCAGTVTPPVVVVTQPSGGWEYFFSRPDRREAERKREVARLAAETIADETDRQIAAFLHAQETHDAERRELERLKAGADAFSEAEVQATFSQRVALAHARALTQQNTSALLAFDRELRRQIEEEEFAVLLVLALDD